MSVSYGIESEDYVFYKDRQEWADVEPVIVTEGPLAVLQQSPKFKDVFDYVRTVFMSGEISERAFKLTTDAAKLNPNNCTVWQLRRKLLFGLGKDLLEELNFTEEMVQENLKNFQVWHHRETVVLHYKNASGELPFLSRMLEIDPKNYFTWQYRQSIVGRFKLFEHELEVVEKYINDDVRNNSAWNHRYFVIISSTDLSHQVLEREVDYVLDAINKDKDNESAWSYIRGILKHHEDGIQHTKVVEFAQLSYTDGVRTVDVLSILLDVANERLVHDDDEKRPARVAWIKLLCQELAGKVDTPRRSYWQFLEDSLGDIGESEESISTDD